MHTTLRSSVRTTLMAGVIGAAAFAGGAATADTFTQPAAQDNPLVQRGCVVRFDTQTAEGKTQPRIHANDSHYCVGVAGQPTVDDQGRLVLKSDSRNEAVVSLTVDEDETLTKKGISCGGSGGGGVTRITCTDRNGAIVAADSPEIRDRYANLWLSWTAWQK